ncbi:lytic murein transglycosylase B [Oceanimonas baumannii]|uniref:Lytic murein transglycosylase B n=1 Tax=Oceanimonas baumannii TaxID=129578 RepID=A0A235CPM0_9GAMM|nr:lytic murein transglycosylase B [Oceanimonas baumannii]OYD26324.1 lytic murein transglycosylase B [Oceanimonas baumannii]TDW62018.1 membrane-bound lytic murein transglycosylase B [Oceanimonas baumannii]
MRLALLSAAVWLSTSVSAAPTVTEQQQWLEELAGKFELSQDALNQAIAGATYQQSIIDAMTRPAEAKPWHDYRPIFLTDKRIEQGVAFWKEHEALLARAEQELQVPAQIIAAIIGVETYYGSHMGTHKVLDALYTLGFHYPPRGTFFRSELGHYLKLAEQQEWSLDEQKGSYAGAMGMGQFISSSYRHYAVDFNDDGHINLFEATDAIGSVANYFHEHKWQFGDPVVHKASVADTDAADALVSSALELKHSWAELAAAGITTEDELAADTPVKLVKLDGADGPEYWVVRHNFYVITRYNRSPLYAMAVYQLSEEIRQAYEQQR